MNKRAGKTIIIIVGLILLGYAGFWAAYYFSMQEANKEGLERACKENTAQEFEGRVIDVNTFDYDDFIHGRFFNLHIRINDHTRDYVDYHYNLKPNREILEFAKVGQKAIKIKGVDTYTLIDSTGEKKTFKVAKCAPIE